LREPTTIRRCKDRLQFFVDQEQPDRQILFKPFSPVFQILIDNPEKNTTHQPPNGVLGSDTALCPRTAAFVQRLREPGRVEGRSIAIVYRSVVGRSEHIAEIVAEFVRLKGRRHSHVCTRRLQSARDNCHSRRRRIECQPGRQRLGRESGPTGRQRGDTLVVRWIDWLGRNYADVTDTIREFIRRQIRIETIINRITFDGTTTDPMQQAARDALIRMDGNVVRPGERMRPIR
jgi:hypothetical protein